MSATKTAGLITGAAAANLIPVTERGCRLRCKLAGQFFLALLDLLLLPIFVPVMLLAYRARPVVDALRSGGAEDCRARLVSHCDPAVRVMTGW